MLTSIASQLIYRDLHKCKDRKLEEETINNNLSIDSKQSKLMKYINKNNIVNKEEIIGSGLNEICEYTDSLIYFIQNNIY